MHIFVDSVSWHIKVICTAMFLCVTNYFQAQWHQYVHSTIVSPINVLPVTHSGQ